MPCSDRAGVSSLPSEERSSANRSRDDRRQLTGSKSHDDVAHHLDGRGAIVDLSQLVLKPVRYVGLLAYPLDRRVNAVKRGAHLLRRTLDDPSAERCLQDLLQQGRRGGVGDDLECQRQLGHDVGQMAQVGGAWRRRFLGQVEGQQPDGMHRSDHRYRDDTDAVGSGAIDGFSQRTGITSHLDHRPAPIDDGIREGATSRCLCPVEWVDHEV